MARTHKVKAGTMGVATPKATPAANAAPALAANAAPALAAVAATLAPAANAAPALAVPNAAPVPAPTVALRGGLAIQAVALTGKPYRVTAAHNVAWWQQVQVAVAAGQGQATVQALVAAGVPAIMVGYLVRRGYCKAATVPAATATA